MFNWLSRKLPRPNAGRAQRIAGVLALCLAYGLTLPAAAKSPAPSARASKARAAAAPVVLELATTFDTERFMGLWYKSGKLDTPQPQLHTRERYELMLRYDGAVRAVHTYYRPLLNQWARQEEYMEPIDKNGSPYRAGQPMDMPMTMRVSRFGNLISMDYKALAIDARYQWALVKSPRSDIFFVLSRKPIMDAALRDSITQLAHRHIPNLGAIRWVEREATD